MDSIKVISGPTGSGKTSELIRLASKSDAYMVVRDQRRAAYVMRRAAEMGVELRFPITGEELLDGRCRGMHPNIQVTIDDVDQFLSHLCDHRLAAFAYTTEGE